MTGIFGTFGLVFAAIIGLIAIAALVIAIKGVIAISRASHLASVGLETTGTIVDNQMESHRQHNSNGFSSTYLTFRPVVKYRTQMGQEVVAVGPASSRRSFVKETTVPIRYNPESPDQIQLLSGHGRGSGGWSMLIGGVVMLIFVAGFAAVAFSMSVSRSVPTIALFESAGASE
jgi:hypothetical protein